MPICEPCKAAGAANKRLNENYPATAGPEDIAKMHSNCPGGTHCACQHFIGQAIQEAYR